MLWNFLYRDLFLGEPYIKTHIVSEELVKQLADSLIARDVPEVQWKFTNKACLDLGGPCMLNRHIHYFDIDDLIVQIPSNDFEIFYDGIQELEARNDIGAEYFKIHSAYQALCLNEEQREKLLVLMSSELQEAIAISEIETNYTREVFSKGKHLANVISLDEYRKSKGIEA